MLNYTKKTDLLRTSNPYIGEMYSICKRLFEHYPQDDLLDIHMAGSYEFSMFKIDGSFAFNYGSFGLSELSWQTSSPFENRFFEELRWFKSITLEPMNLVNLDAEKIREIDAATYKDVYLAFEKCISPYYMADFKYENGRSSCICSIPIWGMFAGLPVSILDFFYVKSDGRKLDNENDYHISVRIACGDEIHYPKFPYYPSAVEALLAISVLFEDNKQLLEKIETPKIDERQIKIWDDLVFRLILNNIDKILDKHFDDLFQLQTLIQVIDIIMSEPAQRQRILFEKTFNKLTSNNLHSLFLEAYIKYIHFHQTQSFRFFSKSDCDINDWHTTKVLSGHYLMNELRNEKFKRQRQPLPF